MTSTRQQAPFYCSQKQASGRRAQPLSTGPSPAPTDTPLPPGTSPLMTNPPAGTGFWAQGADELCCPGWAHLQGLLIPGETWLHFRLLGPSGLSFPICAMGTLFQAPWSLWPQLPYLYNGHTDGFTLQGCAERQSLWAGSCSVNYKGRACGGTRMGQSLSPSPAPGTQSPPWGCRRAEECDQGGGKRGLGLWGAWQGLRVAAEAHSCLLGLVIDQTR